MVAGVMVDVVEGMQAFHPTLELRTGGEAVEEADADPAAEVREARVQLMTLSKSKWMKTTIRLTVMRS